MKVKMLCGMAGEPQLRRNDIVEVNEEIGRAWQLAGIAVAVATDRVSPVETHVAVTETNDAAPSVEAAIKDPARRRRG